MRTQSEVEAALRIARERVKEADEVLFKTPFDSAMHRSAMTELHLWFGRIAAYEFVLGIEPLAPERVIHTRDDEP